MAKKQRTWWQEEQAYCKEMMQSHNDDFRNDEDIRQSDWYEDCYTDILKRLERDW